MISVQSIPHRCRSDGHTTAFVGDSVGTGVDGVDGGGTVVSIGIAVGSGDGVSVSAAGVITGVASDFTDDAGNRRIPLVPDFGRM